MQAVLVGFGVPAAVAVDVPVAALRLVLTLEEHVLLQLLLDLVLQLDQGELQHLHRLDHLRRLDQPLFGAQGLGQTESHLPPF